MPPQEEHQTEIGPLQGAVRHALRCRTEPDHAPTEMPKPIVTITYCTRCNWLLRSAWLAQELLSSFADDLGGVTLVPGTGGIFEIRCAGSLLWERTRDGGFPEAKVLKQRLRDLIDPGRDLGHADRPLP